MTTKDMCWRNNKLERIYISATPKISEAHGNTGTTVSITYKCVIDCVVIKI
jgi:hypothetical protein